jgi:hypothetical protein
LCGWEKWTGHVLLGFALQRPEIERARLDRRGERLPVATGNLEHQVRVVAVHDLHVVVDPLGRDAAGVLSHAAFLP